MSARWRSVLRILAWPAVAGGLLGSITAFLVTQRTLMITFSVVMGTMSALTFLRRDHRNNLPASVDPGRWGGRFEDENGQLVTYRVTRMPDIPVMRIAALLPF